MTRRITTAATVLALFTALQGQGNLPFPTEEYFGGGIGYTPMFLSINIAEAFPFNLKSATDVSTDLLGIGGLGFSEAEIKGLGNLMVIHGAEGFGNITGRWRIGAYVGLGAKSIARVDTATNTLFQLGDSGAERTGQPRRPGRDDGESPYLDRLRLTSGWKLVPR